jgi:hypothetical protein
MKKESRMKSSPYNKKLHFFLLKRGYKYTENVRYDRYDHAGEGVTVFYYINSYIMILDENGEPASKQVTREIEKAL